MSWQGFHITYRDVLGQTLVPDSADLSLLPRELEGYASGLDATGAYADGGPLVLKLERGRRIVGWMRGLPARVGAWEAWGAVGEIKDDLRHWPWYWSELRAGALHVARFAECLDKGCASSGLPEPPPMLPTLLHRFEQQGQPPFVVTMHELADINLLPWIWLLGPVELPVAEFGPPRPRSHASRSFSYEARWHLERDFVPVVPTQHVVDLWRQRIRSLQKDPAALDKIRLEIAGPVTATPTPSVQRPQEADIQIPPSRPPAAPTSATGSDETQPQGSVPGGAEAPALPGPRHVASAVPAGQGAYARKPEPWWSFRRGQPAPELDRSGPERPVVAAQPAVGRRWQILFAALLGISVLLNTATLLAILRWRPQPGAPPTGDPVADYPPVTPAPPTTTVAPAAAPGITCSGDFVSPVEQRALASALVVAVSDGRLRIGKQLAVIALTASAPASPWQPSERKLFVGAAMQVNLRERDCLTIRVIDGLAGSRTSAALTSCPDVAQLTEVEHLRRLCTWLAGP